MNRRCTLLARTVLPLSLVLALLVPSTLPLSANVPPDPTPPVDPAAKAALPAAITPVLPGPIADPATSTIYLLNGAFTPDPGLDVRTGAALEARAAAASAAGISPIHVLLQLDFTPTEAEKEQLAAAGIKLQTYVPNRAWTAAISRSPAQVVGVPGVRWVGDWAGDAKLHPDILAGNWDSWTVHPTENKVMVVMQLHEDVALDRGPELAAAYGGVALPPIEGIHGMTVWLPRENLSGLAAEDEVLWIEPGPAPLTPNNDGVRGSMQVDTLYSVPYNLSGSGVRVFVFDGGLVRTTHNTFDSGSGTRVTQIETGGGTVADHPTHVAGTVAGDGDGTRAKGVAPGASILSAEYDQTGGTMLFWDNAGDIQASYALARTSYNADLGTNSIGSNTASNGYDCAREGDYGVSSNLLDGIVRGDNVTVGSPVIMTWANGNERSGSGGRCGANFLTTAPPACAKNPIHVGAINSDYDSMTYFSSWGPCDDGRMKPVVSAPGCELGRATGEAFVYSSLATSDTAYGGSGWCGTSMATPAAAGVVALMIQDWRSLGNGGANDRPLPALVKAMLIHTARDKGLIGPDYSYGYGEVDATAAIDLLRAGDNHPLGTAGPTVWGADSVTQGAADSYTIYVPAGTGELKASLAWDDYAAAAYSNPAYVNDLNLTLVAPDSTVYGAWVLNPTAPYAAATTGANTRDNQEQVLVTDPAPGTWTVRVAGTTVPQGPQSYGLVYTTRFPVYTAESCAEQITNGGFESMTNWTVSGAVQNTTQKHSGTYSLRLGAANNASHTAYQQVTIPAGSTRAELSFWWYMTTSETSHPWDMFYAEVRNTSDTVLATFDYRQDGGYPSQWVKSANMSLTPWAGQTVRIYFYATTDGSLITTFWVDDVSLSTCGEWTDYSDSAAGYGVAWHAGNGTLRLGSLWTNETSAVQNADNASDDGVTRNYANSWNDTRGEVYVTVTGPANAWACLNAWLDYSDGTAVAGTVETPNNAFDANEHVINNLPIQAGATGQLVTFPLEQGVINSSASYNMRFRLAPATGVQSCSGVTLAATSRADGGEVEDYTFDPGPLAVTLDSMSATAQGSGVLVEWQTAVETDNQGFNLYRDTAADGPGVKLNAAIIPSKAPGGAMGASYEYVDSYQLVSGATYYYWLEDVSLSGATTRHEPVSVVYGAPTSVALADFGAAAGLPLAGLAVGLLAALGLAGLARRRRRG